MIVVAVVAVVEPADVLDSIKRRVNAFRKLLKVDAFSRMN